MMSILYKEQEPFEKVRYRIRGTTPSKVTMPPRRRKLPEVKHKDITLKGTEKPVVEKDK